MHSKKHQEPTQVAEGLTLSDRKVFSFMAEGGKIKTGRRQRLKSGTKVSHPKDVYQGQHRWKPIKKS